MTAAGLQPAERLKLANGFGRNTFRGLNAEAVKERFFTLCPPDPPA
jgi:hypothetical protein